MCGHEWEKRSIEFGFLVPPLLFSAQQKKKITNLGTLSSKSGLRRAITPACWSASMFCEWIRKKDL